MTNVRRKRMSYFLKPGKELQDRAEEVGPLRREVTEV